MSKYCNHCGEECFAGAGAKCLSCVLDLSEIEMKALSRFMEERQKELGAAGLRIRSIERVVNEFTV